MDTYVAFLRAINVGGRTVRMERLRALFTELGLADVATFIASGNVIFRAPIGQGAALESRIAAHLAADLGFEVATFIRTAAQVAAVAAHRPFDHTVSLDPDPDGDVAPPVPPGDVLYIGFLAAPPGAAAHTRVAALNGDVDHFVLHGCELYWRCRKSISKSPVTGPKLEKALGMPTTLRNYTTVRKLAARYAPGEVA